MFNIDVLTSYSFIIVAIGTAILSMSAGAIGCVSVFKGQSLIGDAIGHAAFPGVVLAFMLNMSRNPIILLIGAIIAGALAFAFIQIIEKNLKIGFDAALAIALSTFFGLGMVLKSYIQGNSNFKGASQAGLQSYIFGQAAYIMASDVKLILAVCITSILLLIIFYKEIKLFVFDEVYAKCIGIKSNILNALILIMTMGIIGCGLKLVGSILIASLIIVPTIAAKSWSDKFSVVLILSAFIGAIASVVGTYISTIY